VIYKDHSHTEASIVHSIKAALIYNVHDRRRISDSEVKKFVRIFTTEIMPRMNPNKMNCFDLFHNTIYDSSFSTCHIE
jgi:hypothetical protein